MLKYFTSYIPDGFTTNMVRYPLATLFYAPLLLHEIRRGRLGTFWLWALIPTFVNITSQTLWAWTPYYLDPGVIGFSIRLSMIWSILGAFLVFADERQIARSPIFWVGVALAFVGFATMSWSSVTKTTGASLFGLVLVLACSMFYGLYGVTVRYVMRDLNPLTTFGVIGSYTSIGLLLMAPLGQPSSVLAMPAWPMAILALSAIVGITCAHGMYYMAVQRIGVAVSTLMLSATPFVTILGSSIILGERFSLTQWIGGLGLVAGATLAAWTQQQLPTPPIPDPRETANE